MDVGRPRSFGLVLAAGVLAFIIFGIWLLAATFLVEYFRSQELLEARLFMDSFLKPVALVWLAAWVSLSGIFLDRSGARSWGWQLFYIYVAVSVLPYLLSFGVS